MKYLDIKDPDDKKEFIRLCDSGEYNVVNINHDKLTKYGEWGDVGNGFSTYECIVNYQDKTLMILR
jgi:hypothetical protein